MLAIVIVGITNSVTSLVANLVWSLLKVISAMAVAVLLLITHYVLTAPCASSRVGCLMPRAWLYVGMMQAT